MKKEEIITKNISSNIAYYRQLNNLTQFELATILNYSDKSISKWERGEGLPSIFVLTELATFFGVSIDDFVNKQKVKPKEEKQLKPLLYSLVLWLVSLITFSALLIFRVKYHAWHLLILASSFSGLIFFVFNLVWKKKTYYYLSLLVFIYCLALFFHLTFVVKPYIYYTIATSLYIFISYLLFYLSRKK